MFLKTCQLLFMFLILSSLLIGSRIVGNIQIETSLADLSPGNSSENLAEAKLQLSRNIQNRLLLLISGSDEDAVLDASDQLRQSLLNLLNSQKDLLNAIEFQVLDDNETVALDLIDKLHDYRFKLLTAKQRKALETKSSQEIISLAKRRLYNLAGENRLYSFKDDPLAWHSDYLIQLFRSLDVQTVEASTDSNTGNVSHSIISMAVNQAQMNLEQQAKLLVLLDTLTSEISNHYDVSIDRSGVFFFAVDAASKSKQDISLITTGSSIGVILLLLIAFRSMRSFVLPIVSIASGVCVAFVVLHAVYGKVHVLTIVFGASLIGIVVDYSLHYFYHRASSERNDSNSGPLYRALFLSLLTSLIGYSALSFSSLEALQKVALFSCVGLTVAWLSVISIGELLSKKTLILDRYFLPFLARTGSALMSRVGTNAWIYLALILISAALLASFRLSIFSDDPRLFYAASDEIVRSERAVAKVSNDFEPGRYLSVSGDDLLDVYTRSENLFLEVDGHPHLDRTDLVSIINWVPSLRQQTQDYKTLGSTYLNNEDNKFDVFYEEVSSLDALNDFRRQFIDARTKFLLPSDILEMLGSSAPPIWFESSDLITNFILVRKGVDHSAVKQVAQNSGVTYINTLAETTFSLKQQRLDASKLLILAYVLIAVLLLVRYRSIQSMSMLLVPLTSSALVILICLLFGVSLNLFHMMALFLVLGFGMDYTIFVREFDNHRAITLQAILLSAMTSLLSFGLLAISSIPVAQAFGSTLLVGNCFNLIGVFVYSSHSAKFEQSI